MINDIALWVLVIAIVALLAGLRSAGRGYPAAHLSDLDDMRRERERR